MKSAKLEKAKDGHLFMGRNYYGYFAQNCGVWYRRKLSIFKGKIEFLEESCSTVLQDIDVRGCDFRGRAWAGLYRAYTSLDRKNITAEQDDRFCRWVAEAKRGRGFGIY